ncbi:hypothetical protein [Shewanella seohaensis]|uniref:hypothetical protein n=1 Tax=Shewanella seohaensis TaxID=755175 RepID=UPI0035B7CF04
MEEITRSAQQLVERLNELLPELEYSRETHIIWRDCDQKYRDEQPAVGDVKHHKNCIAEYDKRIAVIKEAIEFIKALA